MRAAPPPVPNLFPTFPRGGGGTTAPGEGGGGGPTVPNISNDFPNTVSAARTVRCHLVRGLGMPRRPIAGTPPAKIVSQTLTAPEAACTTRSEENRNHVGRSALKTPGDSRTIHGQSKPLENYQQTQNTGRNSGSLPRPKEFLCQVKSLPCPATGWRFEFDLINGRPMLG